MNKIERWSLIILEVLFSLCALSVIVYQFTGRFDFGFGIISYRFFNIAISLAVIAYIIYGLLKSKPHVLIVLAIFSLLHLVEGVVILFWYKTVIHFLILMIVSWHNFHYGTIKLMVAGNHHDQGSWGYDDESNSGR